MTPGQYVAMYIWGTGFVAGVSLMGYTLVGMFGAGFGLLAGSFFMLVMMTGANHA